MGARPARGVAARRPFSFLYPFFAAGVRFPGVMLPCIKRGRRAHHARGAARPRWPRIYRVPASGAGVGPWRVCLAPAAACRAAEPVSGVPHGAPMAAGLAASCARGLPRLFPHRKKD